jgi:hypothetical protein
MAEQKIDLKSLAEQLGMSESDVKQWLTNQGYGPNTTQAQFNANAPATTTPKGDQWQQLATALGISIPKAHQDIANLQSGAEALGQNESVGQLIQQAIAKAGAAPSQTKLREGAQNYGGYTSKQWAALSPEDKAQAINEYVNDPNTQVFSPGTIKTAEANVKAGGAPTPLPGPGTAAKTAPQSPYEELANSLANMYLQQVNQLEPLISGQGIYGPGGQTAQAVQGASQMVPGAAGWLGQQAAAEGQASKPLQAAMGQVGNAQAAGALNVVPAIANTGLANTEYLQSAPYQQILSELANETAYRAASSGASAFGSSPLASSPLLQQIFGQLGLGGTGSAGLTVPGAKTAGKGGTTGTTTATSGTGNPSGP